MYIYIYIYIIPISYIYKHICISDLFQACGDPLVGALALVPLPLGTRNLYSMLMRERESQR